MTDYTQSSGEKDLAVTKEENRLRKRFSATDEITFTIQQPQSLDDDDIEVVAVTVTVPCSALLEKMVVRKQTPFKRKDRVYADNDDGEDAFRDGGFPGGDLPQ